MIFNMVGGGGGGLKDTDAVLIVTVPTGSTVTATKSGTTLTPTIWVQSADNTLDTAIFSIKASTFDANAWTVTATLGADTASDTVVIDSAEEYSMELAYRLPSGYTEVEYLQSTGTQYLLLPITNNNIKGGSIKFIKVTEVSYSGLFGGDNTAYSHTNTSLGLFLSSSGDGQGFEYCKSRKTLGGFSTSTEYVLNFSITSGSQSYELNGTSYSGTQSGTPSEIQTALFAYSYNGTIKSAEISKAKVYYCTFTDSNGDNICELIPCYRIADSVAGMWDRVSRTFLTNQGNGSFTVGADVT